MNAKKKPYGKKLKTTMQKEHKHMKATKHSPSMVAFSLGVAAAIFMAAASSGTAQQLINVQFADGNPGFSIAPSYTGPGMVVGSPGDLWNMVFGVDGMTPGSFGPLTNSAGTVTAVTLTFGTDTWKSFVDYSDTYNWWGIHGDLVQNAVTFWPSIGPSDTITLSGLDDTKTYDVYLYNGPDNGFGGNYIVNGVTNTMYASSSWQDPWILGDEYTGFHYVPTDGSGNIVITMEPSIACYWASYLCGLQVYALPPIAPAVTSQPASETRYVGETATFTAVVTGFPIPAFQWTINGTNILGATNQTLVLTNVQLTNAGSYVLHATNSLSGISTTPVTLTVLPQTNLLGLINVQFGAINDPPSPIYTGPGPVVGSPGDLWNQVLGVGGMSPGSFGPFTNTIGTATPVTLTFGQVDWKDFYNFSSSWLGEFGPLVENVVRWWWSPDTVTISGLNSAYNYDIYLFNGPYDETWGEYTINGVTKTMTAAGSSITPWLVEDEYVVFPGVSADLSGNIVITVTPEIPAGQSTPYADLSGLQIYTADQPIAPAVRLQPVNETRYADTTVIFAPVISGYPTPVFQWTSNGSNIPGATNQTLVLANVQLTNTGSSYVLCATNSLGGISTTPVTLTLLPSPVSSAYAMAVLANNPMGYWRFSDGGGTNAYDYCGGNDAYDTNYLFNGGSGPATLLAGPQPPAFPGFESTNTAPFLDGISQGYASSVPLFNYLSSFTIMGWFNINPAQYPFVDPYANIEGRASLFGQVWAAEVGFVGGTNLYFWASGISQAIVVTNGFEPGMWHFVAAVSDTTAGTTTLYLDGAVVGTAGACPGTVNNNLFCIGKDVSYPPVGGYDSAFFGGSIDEVAAFDHALPASTIQSLYEASKSFKLNIQPQVGGYQVSWPVGHLLSATNVAGPWQTVPGAVSPFSVTPSTGSPSMFYRCVNP